MFSPCMAADALSSLTMQQSMRNAALAGGTHIAQRMAAMSPIGMAAGWQLTKGHCAMACPHKAQEWAGGDERLRSHLRRHGCVIRPDRDEGGANGGALGSHIDAGGSNAHTLGRNVDSLHNAELHRSPEAEA